MKSLIYWMVFQIMIGAWLFVSPFVLGFRELTGPAVGNMVFGTIVILLGFGVAMYELYHKDENVCEMREPEGKTS